jgi:hypothetical protein
MGFTEVSEAPFLILSFSANLIREHLTLYPMGNQPCLTVGTSHHMYAEQQMAPQDYTGKQKRSVYLINMEFYRKGWIDPSFVYQEHMYKNQIFCEHVYIIFIVLISLTYSFK